MQIPVYDFVQLDLFAFILTTHNETFMSHCIMSHCQSTILSTLSLCTSIHMLVSDRTRTSSTRTAFWGEYRKNICHNMRTREHQSNSWKPFLDRVLYSTVQSTIRKTIINTGTSSTVMLYLQISESNPCN